MKGDFLEYRAISKWKQKHDDGNNNELVDLDNDDASGFEVARVWIANSWI